MEIKHIESSCHIVAPKKVWVAGHEGHTRDEIIDFAMAAVGERRATLWDVKTTSPNDDNEIVVVMFRD